MGSTALTVVLVVFVGLSRGQLPEDDFRIVSRQDLLASESDIFEDKSSKSFSQLLFDVARDQVIVGARDVLYRLSLRRLHQLERADWAAPNDTAKSCQVKGQSEDDCHNYVKVLLPFGHKVFACGTNAFSPLCSWREIESISSVSEWVGGVALGPCSPRSNVTAILASSGEYYAGTPTDFTSSDTAISRSKGAALRNMGMLRTTQYDSNWLNEPQFVGSFEDELFIYFVFREVAVEYMNCGKTIYSRIARVCKNDSVGPYMPKNLAIGTWSTFLKARLVCKVAGEIDFFYDEVQSVEYLPQEQILVATFTTNRNSIAGSAVCIYNMSSVHAAFDGPYMVQKKPGYPWESLQPSSQAKDHFKCINSDRNLQTTEYYRYQLMHKPVEPISDKPLYEATLQRFTHVTVDVIPTKFGRQLVVYVATEESKILKLAALPQLTTTCLVEILKLKDSRGGFDVLALQFVKETMSLYIGSETGVVRVGGERCSRYKSETACTSAADPHCGWDMTRDVCLHSYDTNLVAAATVCPSGVTAVNGSWSTWSDWSPCSQYGTEHAEYGAAADLCACRTRRCDNPAPANGGMPCQGESISVTNCTVHGGWSPWSPWSECSTTCGIAVKSRRRTCTAPAPKFGGRVCVGEDSQDVFCIDVPPCPDLQIDGGWSAWSNWSACTSAGGPGCGPAAGWRERRRTCTNPAPKHGGLDCEGMKIDRQICDMRPCEMRKATTWTPWVHIPGNSSDGSYMEKRFKVLFKAPSSEQIRISITRDEERYCNIQGFCTSLPPEEGGWEPWGPWGECSAPCGGGHQARTRKCKGAPCEGPKDMLRACNTHVCSGEWSCWTEWSECVGCDANGGRRTRTRMCISPEGCADAGAALETKTCFDSNCPGNDLGWSPWGEWTTCDNGERLRRRTCAAEPCEGAQIQVRRGDYVADIDNEIYAMPAYAPSVERVAAAAFGSSGPMSIGGIIGCVVAAFVMGCLLCLAAVVYCQRRGSLPWDRRLRVPSSPHYMSKQNSYVTVPLKEVPRKAKRQPSFSGIGGSSGIMLSKSNNIVNANNHNSNMTTPKLYPKAIANEYESTTMRRHSNQPHKNNIDLEEDKFY